jgi:hypothetical protein
LNPAATTPVYNDGCVIIQLTHVNKDTALLTVTVHSEELLQVNKLHPGNQYSEWLTDYNSKVLDECTSDWLTD